MNKLNEKAVLVAMNEIDLEKEEAQEYVNEEVEAYMDKDETLTQECALEMLIDNLLVNA